MTGSPSHNHCRGARNRAPDGDCWSSTSVTPLVHELAVDGYPVAVTCRVLKVSTSTYYDWLKPRPPSSRDGRRLPAGRDHRHPPHRPRHLRGSAGARGAHLGPTAYVLPAAGGAADAPALPQGVHRRRWRHGHPPRRCFRTWSSDSSPPSPAAVRSPAASSTATGDLRADSTGRRNTS